MGVWVEKFRPVEWISSYFSCETDYHYMVVQDSDCLALSTFPKGSLLYHFFK